MEGSFLVAALSIVTIAGALVFAMVSKRRTEARKDNPNAPKSSLAADGADNQ